jgi:hypothetical protein
MRNVSLGMSSWEVVLNHRIESFRIPEHECDTLASMIFSPTGGVVESATSRRSR